ncbi:MAG: hypothetical protein JW768_11735 [Chitinispirillaceae bacterium]|nr:hypothetical protein [Chitinispirillaceae bacterium]
MKHLITLTALFSMMLLPGCASTAQAGGTSVSVSVGFSSGYVTCYDEDMEWDNLIVIDNSRVGFWVMLPSGRWVFRCRSMWWSSAYDEWCFGPWYYDYSIVYRCHCHSHYHPYCPFHGIRFHVYMHKHYPKWHKRHFIHHRGAYVRRVDSHHRDRHGATVVRHVERRNGKDVQTHHQSQKQKDVVREKRTPVRTIKKTTTVTREIQTPVRTNETRRSASISNNQSTKQQVKVTRSRTVVRQPAQTRTSKSVTRTQTRKNSRKR